MRAAAIFSLAVGAALVLVASGARAADTERAFERTEEREDCAHYEKLRRPFFGDTHVHTTYSFDAWGQGTRNTPRDAYRFARGERVGIQPYGEDGEPVRSVELARPLDFTMVSDHAEMLGETDLCRTPGSPSYSAFACVMLRRWPRLGYMIVNSQWSSAGGRRKDLCGEDGEICRQAARTPWRATQDAAEEFYDRSSACRFTSFVGFEWSGARAGMIHRNVLFRNAVVPDSLPNASDDGHDERRLWDRLDRDCIEAGTGCDVLAIPHNSNVSMGSQFWTVSPEGVPLDAARAAQRARLEPLVEITQHKGDSECRAGGEDDLCSFETLGFGDIAGHASSLFQDEVPPGVYVREALLEGIRQQNAIGVNPFKLGIIGATDSHLGTPGLVDEDSFVGHAAGVVSSRLEVPPLPDHVLFNPGGLAGVWAEENSRDSLFASMRRRETFGTSGPRISVRFFGGWGWGPKEPLCRGGRFVERGYAEGVPMGSDLPPPTSTAPTFAVWALRDPGSEGHPGTALQRVQIVKGWMEQGELREKVIEVAGNPADSAEVDVDTCSPSGPGLDQICGVWQDRKFDPSSNAFYYARVVENPSCRWSTYACNAAEVDCSAGAPRGPLAACCDASVPKTIQERAWTSPIWYEADPEIGARGLRNAGQD